MCGCEGEEGGMCVEVEGSECVGDVRGRREGCVKSTVGKYNIQLYYCSITSCLPFSLNDKALCMYLGTS